MENSRFVSFFLIGLSFLVLSCSRAHADAGVFTGNGQNLHQISSKEVQLVSIDVRIVLGRGPFLFDSGVAGMDRVEYLCRFSLRNLSDEAVDVLVGFPVDSQFARDEEINAQTSAEWVLGYAFIARDNATTYHVDFVHRKPNKGEGEFSSIFTWKMRFAPKENRELVVEYHIPMSMGLAETRKDQKLRAPRKDFTGMDVFLEEGEVEWVGYITSTGSSWAGNVESATFTMITEPFERYFDFRGFDERGPIDISSEEGRSFAESFPVRHPWWFRKITPDGWKPVEGGVQWKYTNFKPHDSIGVSYFITQFPRLPEEVDPFVDRIENGLGKTAETAQRLRIFREILLATYGKEPVGQAAKDFSAAQEWYSPRESFVMSDLSTTQQAVLKRLDLRIESLKAKP